MAHSFVLTDEYINALTENIVDRGAEPSCFTLKNGDSVVGSKYIIDACATREVSSGDKTYTYYDIICTIPPSESSVSFDEMEVYYKMDGEGDDVLLGTYTATTPISVPANTSYTLRASFSIQNPNSTVEVVGANSVEPSMYYDKMIESIEEALMAMDNTNDQFNAFYNNVYDDIYAIASVLANKWNEQTGL